MKKQCLFIHSAGPQGPHEGSDDFITFLQKAVGTDYDLLCPKMPDPGQPNYAAWRNEVARAIATVPEDAVLMGHSLGGSVLLKYLAEEAVDKRFAALFIVASPYWGGDSDWSYSEFTLPEDFAAKLPPIGQIFIYHSRDDEVVPERHAALYAEKLPQAILRELDHSGHAFTQGAPELVTDLESLVK
ncbi:MAG TPA: alpha/beta fold hydrolase [Chloroflexia bacterium]|nr:alpha/beta fold hydrolase [Chloroflexia bacterium]